MIERIIVLSGKIKGVAKCERGADGVMHCEFASQSAMDIAVAYDDRIVVHKKMHSGEKFTMGVPTSRNIGVAILDSGDIIAHGKCGNGLSAAALAAFAAEELLAAERELYADTNEDFKIVKEEEIVENIAPNDLPSYDDKRKNNAEAMIENVRQSNEDRIIAEEEKIFQAEIDMYVNANNSKSPNEESAECEARVIQTSETINDETAALELTDLFKDTIVVEECNTQKLSVDTHNVESTDLAEDYEQCGKVCAKMINERFENDIDDSSIPFYVKIADQLKNLFDTYPRETQLEELVHESTWARIPFGDDEYYVVGVISEARQPIFICYGLPRDLRDDPCPELTKHAEWLPLDRTNVDGKGYWVMYQDAVSGENF